MKKLLLFLSLSFLVTTYSYSQSMARFFEDKAVYYLADMAHPTNTYKSGTYDLYTNYVLVNIYYEGYTTKLKVYRSGNIFTEIEVLYDNDWPPAFSFFDVIKDLAIKVLAENEESSKSLTEFERSIGKGLQDMTGKEMACAILTIGWIDY